MRSDDFSVVERVFYVNWHELVWTVVELRELLGPDDVD
jgi:hypothetical protein